MSSDTIHNGSYEPPAVRHVISRFRSPSNIRYTRLLFWDMQHALPIDQRRGVTPLYTLHHDRPGMINFRRVYVELGDPTGYAVATKLLEDYSHWQLLMKAPWFREAKEQWDIELDAKLESEGLTTIRAYAEGIEGVAPAVTLSAAKFLATRKSPKATSARGRPSKEEVAGELKNAAEDAAVFAADVARITGIKGV